MSSGPPYRDVSVSEQVVRRVANCEDVDPLELPRLYDAIDPDALDALVRTADRQGSTLRVEFTYHGHEVSITGDGVVDLDGETPPVLTGN